MARYKLTYEKKYHLIFGTSWDCNLYDRKYDATYYGSGDTRNLAKENAWDKYYETQRSKSNNRSNSYSVSSNYDSDTTSSYESSSSSDDEYAAVPVFIVIANILGFGSSIWGLQQSIERSSNPSAEKIAGIIGLVLMAIPLFIIYSIIGGIIGFIICWLISQSKK